MSLLHIVFLGNKVQTNKNMRRINKSGKKQQPGVLGVGVSIDEMRFVKDLITDIAGRRRDLGYSDAAVPEGRLARCGEW